MATNTLTVTDNRTGKSYDVPIVNGAIRAMDLRQIRVGPDDFGLMAYDPAFTNTASTVSRITFIDGDKGILRYRGYPIEELAARSNYLEVAYLLLNGELPTLTQMDEWVYQITHHTWIHENIKKFMDGFHYDAHPMGMLVSTVGALSTFYPGRQEHPRRRDFAQKADLAPDRQDARRWPPSPIATAWACPTPIPDNELSYPGNFLNMLFKTTELKYRPNPVLERALDVLFILHADHEQNCSTNAMRCVGSSQVDPYSATAGGGGGAVRPAARRGQRGGAAHAGGYRVHVQRSRVHQAREGRREEAHGLRPPRLQELRPARQDHQEDGRPGVRGHGPNPLLDIALELERIALEDEYFVTRKLYPNVDFYSGLIYQAMGFPVDMFPVLFAIPRTSGWLAQWQEMLPDPEQKIARPRQIYLGAGRRDYVAIGAREAGRDRGRGPDPTGPPARGRGGGRACDLACRHCRAEAAPEPDPGELGPEEGRRLLDDLMRFGSPLPHLVLTGGDPLKRADLFPLIEAARARGFAVSVAPSGTPLFTAGAVRRLVAAGVEAISLSLDGSTAAQHDRLRGVPGCFERTLMAARECAAAGLPFQVNTLVSEETLADLPGIHDLASSLGALRWSLFFLVAVGRGSVLRPISAEAAEELFEQLLELAGQAGPAVTTTEAPHFRRVAMERGGRQAGGPGERHRAIGHSSGIRDGNGIMFISHTGLVCPSGFLPLSAGNVRTADLVELYRGSDLFRALRRAEGFGGRCGRCEYRDACGGSRARAWAATGDPLAEDPLCRYEPAAAPRGRV